MSIRKLVPALIAGSLAGATAILGVVAAYAGPHASSVAGTQQHVGKASTSQQEAVYLAAGLAGRNEVPAGVGDPDGRATAVVRISGDVVAFAVRWQNITAPRGFHIHQGAAGTNGGIKVDFFGSLLPAGVDAVSGSVKVTDRALLDSIRTDPTGFYLNLHTTEFANGAVRGQAHPLKHPVDLKGVLNGSSAANLQAVADGKQEVPAGDRDGRARWMLGASGDKLSYTAVWDGIGAPTKAHVHAGPKGTNGQIVVDFFADPDGLPASVNGIAGTAPLPAAVATGLASEPSRFYANLHTAEFPDGAVRGQLATNTGGQPRAVNAAVVGGSQIYRCAAQPAGGFAFSQFGVAAVLRDGILHSFARPVSGPPQWIAPDGTAVTGTLVRNTPNGAGNIGELLLEAEQFGGRSGILEDTTQILRLNTVGGVAPAGPCDPETQSIATVPYQADYLFLG